MRHNRECNHYRTQHFRSTQIMAHMGTQANISGITCHSNAAFAKQMCLETTVKGFLSLNKNATNSRPNTQVECTITNSLSHFVLTLSTDKTQQVLREVCGTAQSDSGAAELGYAYDD